MPDARLTRVAVGVEGVESAEEGFAPEGLGERCKCKKRINLTVRDSSDAQLVADNFVTLDLTHIRPLHHDSPHLTHDTWFSRFFIIKNIFHKLYNTKLCITHFIANALRKLYSSRSILYDDWNASSKRLKWCDVLDAFYGKQEPNSAYVAEASENWARQPLVSLLLCLSLFPSFSFSSAFSLSHSFPSPSPLTLPPIAPECS